MKVPVYAWMFASMSSPATYETLRYDDGSLSCNCMGWVRRVAKDGTRSCKHTRMVELNLINNCLKQGPVGLPHITLHKPIIVVKEDAQPAPPSTPPKPFARKLNLS